MPIVRKEFKKKGEIVWLILSYRLPNPKNEDYGIGFKGFLYALINKTNEGYKKKARKDFDAWMKFKKENHNHSYPNKVFIKTDKDKEEMILKWLNSCDISRLGYGISE